MKYFACKRMFVLMVADNRSRDELMLNIVERLTPTNGERQSRNASDDEGGFHLMPDLTKILGYSMVIEMPTT